MTYRQTETRLAQLTPIIIPFSLTFCFFLKNKELVCVLPVAILYHICLGRKSSQGAGLRDKNPLTAELPGPCNVALGSLCPRTRCTGVSPVQPGPSTAQQAGHPLTSAGRAPALLQLAMLFPSFSVVQAPFFAKARQGSCPRR